jgi:TusA-related sulfurtransferase
MPADCRYDPPDETIDLKGVPCPANSSRVLLRLEAMEDGEILEVFVDDGEPVENVPRSVEDEGHTIILREEAGGGAWRLLIMKGGS